MRFHYDDGIHPYMDNPPPSMYDPHVAHRPLQSLAHHSPHMNHGMHQYHAANHVAPVSNHVMGSVPDVHKRDKDAIYGETMKKISQCGVSEGLVVVLVPGSDGSLSAKRACSHVGEC
uniref:(California timema) hypothetical protein n=1 Tax=Timema californicum TaxID=61474 RepID=A0A7R9P6K6_TIMCA|nr:unnamed protein product [Timema californicum]